MLGGCAAVEAAAKKGGQDVKVPFTPGRTDATQEMTDVESFAVLEPTADGFRNYHRKGDERPAPELLIDRARQLTLSAPEMTVLLGGLRVLGANVGQSKLGVFTERPGSLTNDFFVNLLDMSTEWRKSRATTCTRGATARRAKSSGPARTSISSSARTRSSGRSREVYACDDSQQKFVRDFVAAWNKVMNLDRFELAARA